MSDVYLIKGETLTAIADAIRQNGPASVQYQMTPEQMPDNIVTTVMSNNQEGYNEGHNQGYNKGYDEGASEAITASKNGTMPIFMQNNSSPRESFNGVGYYSLNTFAKYGYTIDDFIEYNAVAESDHFVVSVVNKTGLTVGVCLYAECYSYADYDGEYIWEELWKSGTISANSNGSVYVISSGTSDYSWEGHEIFVRFDV